MKSVYLWKRLKNKMMLAKKESRFILIKNDENKHFFLCESELK